MSRSDPRLRRLFALSASAALVVAALVWIIWDFAQDDHPTIDAAGSGGSESRNVTRRARQTPDLRSTSRPMSESQPAAVADNAPDQSLRCDADLPILLRCVDDRGITVAGADITLVMSEPAISDTIGSRIIGRTDADGKLAWTPIGLRRVTVAAVEASRGLAGDSEILAPGGRATIVMRPSGRVLVRVRDRDDQPLGAVVTLRSTSPGDEHRVYRQETELDGTTLIRGIGFGTYSGNVTVHTPNLAFASIDEFEVNATERSIDVVVSIPQSLTLRVIDPAGTVPESIDVRLIGLARRSLGRRRPAADGTFALPRPMRKGSIEISDASSNAAIVSLVGETLVPSSMNDGVATIRLSAPCRIEGTVSPIGAKRLRVELTLHIVTESGVTVCDTRQTVPDASGRFAFERLPNNVRWILECSGDFTRSHAPLSGSTGEAGTTSRATIELTEVTPIRILVVDDAGRPVENAVVSVSPAQPIIVKNRTIDLARIRRGSTFVTDEGGCATASALLESTVVIEVSKSGYLPPERVTFDVDAPNAVAQVELHRTELMYGRVVAADGSIADNLAVKIFTAGGEKLAPIAETKTSKDGTFRFLAPTSARRLIFKVISNGKDKRLELTRDRWNPLVIELD